MENYIKYIMENYIKYIMENYIKPGKILLDTKNLPLNPGFPLDLENLEK